MRLNLESLRADIQNHLESRGMAVFHGWPRGSEQTAAVYWNTESHPDYEAFLAAAETAGVRLVTLYANEFSEEAIEDALARLDESALPREQRRDIESRLREIRGYAGFICQVELSFDLAQRVYVFDLRTEWFDELNEMLDRIEEGFSEEEDEDEEPLGGYFSKN
jgi:hypothetical protein